MQDEGKKAAGSDRPIVKISQEKSKHYNRQLQKFEAAFKKSKEEFEHSKQQTYFLLSTNFITAWRQFCQSQQEKRFQIPAFNTDLIELPSKNLKTGLREGEDFQIVDLETHSIVAQNAKGTSILRKARKVGNQKKVQIYLQTYTYIPLSEAELKAIDKKQMDLQKFKAKVKQIQQSQYSTVKQFCKLVGQTENLGQRSIRLWRVAKDITIQMLYKDIKHKVQPLHWNQYKIKGIGRRIDDNQTRLSDLNLEDKQYFIIEHKTEMKEWFLQADTQGKCQGCYKVKELKFPCACKKVAYCTEPCKEKDKIYHEKRCPAAEQQELNQKIQMKYTANSMKGLVGLSNLGNTCFMNSCLQCLSNTYPLTKYFLQSHYESEINLVNPLGTKGKLAKCYAKFLKAMWCDSESTFSPYNLKSAVSSIAPMFSGYAQHDSQQFFSFIVDGLHEDLNRVQKKPIVEPVESKGRPDKQVALESWLAHIKRNQSIIADLMTGQYKSKVICPDCGKQSITFDPFITVTLPIPQENSNSIQPYSIFHNFNQETKKISIKYTKPNLNEWLARASELLKVDSSRLRFYLLTMSEGIYRVDEKSMSAMLSRIQHEGRNLFIIQLSEEEAKIKEPIELTTRFSKKSYYHDGAQALWFKVPFFFQSKKLTGLTIFKRILSYLYHQAYDHSTKRSSYWGSKSFEEYEKLMIKERPFILYLRYGLKKQKYYTKVQYKFEEEIQIQDNTNIEDLIRKINQTDYQIDARFTKEGVKSFTLQNLKQFKDCTERERRGYSSEDVTVKLQECFQVLGEPQKLQVGNEWYCPACKQHKLATKQLSIYKAPQVLILHLKRFKQKGSYRKQKNQSHVIFPMSMDFSPYLIDPTPISLYRDHPNIKNSIITKSSYEVPTKDVGAQYQLYAVSNHYGGLGGGHYTAFGKNINGKWYEFNDSSVRSTSQSNVCSSGAYILFYKRKD